MEQAVEGNCNISYTKAFQKETACASSWDDIGTACPASVQEFELDDV